MSTTSGKITVINRTEERVTINVDQSGVVSGRWSGYLNPGAASGVQVSGFASYTVAFLNANYTPPGSQFSNAMRADAVVPPAVVTLATSVSTRPVRSDDTADR